MSYRSLQDCVADLERQGQLLRFTQPVDPHLEMAEIQRRLYRVQGPAVLFERVLGSPFPVLGNLFGSPKRAHFIFRKTLENVKKMLKIKAEPEQFFRRPWQYAGVPRVLMHSLPQRVMRAPVLAHKTQVSQLPQIKSWPQDGGPFITLGQVYTESLSQPGVLHSNLGMYRIQMAGNAYQRDQELGLHYQIHRGIGVHHAEALAADQPLKVSIFIGGSPAHTLAAIMPLPEGLSELLFAGALAGRRFRYLRRNGFLISADADFCITGTVDPGQLKPEGPFGDHLGYYSLTHDFPVLKVENVYHRQGAIWPFTVVGRPPQEDTVFGQLIHEIVAPMVPRELPGLKALHAVDAAGVHPLLLAIGSERYTPYAPARRPQEILTIANAVLGFGQASLAKYLLIAAGEDNPALDIQDIPAFFRHMLERVDWRTDLHFQTCTTMDTLDYSGTGLNAGSKLVIAAVGAPRRTLNTVLPPLLKLPEGFSAPKRVMPGVVAVTGPRHVSVKVGEESAEQLVQALASQGTALDALPLWVLVDDSIFTAAQLNNFLWVTFTRSNPAHDVYGAGSFSNHKHWGCSGPLVIDARQKPHHAPPIEADPAVSRRVDSLFARGGILESWG